MTAAPARPAAADAATLPYDESAEPVCVVTAGPDGRARIDGPVSWSGGLRGDEGGGGEAGGAHARWHFDGTALTAEVDRLGMFPLFYCHDGRRCALSPSLARLVRALGLTEIDREAMAVFVHIGMFVGEDTPFAGVRVMPPGGRLRFAPGEAAPWSLSGRRPEVGPVRGTREQLVDRMAEALSAAVRRVGRAVEGRAVWLPLSGGLDSRRLLGAWTGQGLPLTGTFTVDGDFAKLGDAGPAAELARICGVPHEVAPPFPRFQGTLLRNVLTHFCSDEHEWYVAVARFMSRRPSGPAGGGGRPVVVDGIAGDLHRGHPPWAAGLFASGDFGELAERWLGRDATPLARQVPPDMLPDDVRGAARARLVEELATHADAPNPVSSFLFWVRKRREIALQPWGVMRPFADAAGPFLDRELWELMVGLPAAVADEAFHLDWVGRRYPALRGVALGRGQRTPAGQKLGLLRDAARTWRRAQAWGVGVPASPIRLAATTVRKGLSARSRARAAYMSPKWLSYFAHLEHLRRTAAAEPFTS